MSTRFVKAVETTAPMYFYDNNENRRKLGDVVIERYDDDAVATYSYIPDSDNGLTERTKRPRDVYRLGVGSGKIDTINPADVQEVIMEAGWRPAFNFRHTRSGAGLRFVYYNPQRAWDDPITYDQQLWPGKGQIFHGMSVEFNLRIHNMAVKIREGLFRTICTNGLMSTILSLGQIDMRHSITSRNFKEAIESTFINPEKLPGMAPVMTVETLSMVAHSLYHHYETLAANGKYLRKNEIALGQLAAFRTHIMPRPLFYNFHNALGVIIRSHEQDNGVSAFDLVNAYTSAVNKLETADTVGWSADVNIDPAVKAVIELGDFAEFFQFGVRLHNAKDISVAQITASAQDTLDVSLDDIETPDVDSSIDEDMWDLSSYLKGID